MPRFSNCCKTPNGGKDCCSGCVESEWLEGDAFAKVTGRKGKGNVCQECQDKVYDGPDLDIYLTGKRTHDTEKFLRGNVVEATRKFYLRNQTRPVSDDKVMFAKYAGQCKPCGAKFPAGTEIRWSRVKGARHVTCPKTPVAQRRPVPQTTNVSDGPVSLYEYCRMESGGLTGVALDQYVNRYYGHN